MVNNNKIQCQLSIPGLPDEFSSFGSGKVYALGLENVRCLDFLLENFMARKIKLITFRNVEEVFPSVNKAREINRFDVFTLPKKRFEKIRFKLNRLLTELSHLDPKDNIILFDLSSKIISKNHLDNINLLHTLRMFAIQNNAVLILTFSLDGYEMSDFINSYQQDFYGVIKVTGATYPAKLHFPHWFFSLGSYVNKHFVTKVINGSLSIPSSDELSSVKNNDDEVVVLIDHHHLYLPDSIDKSWQKSNDVEHMDTLVSRYPAATILCHTLMEEPFSDLAKRIYRWRQISGENLKIVVLEVDLNLRMAEQKILKSLGASIILPAKLNLTILSSLINSIQELKYYGDLTEDFSQLFNQNTIPIERGYIEPIRFLELIRTFVYNSGVYNIEGAFIYLEVPTGIPILETIRHSSFNRSGDLFTIIDNQIIIYLYGCREENVANTLKNILGVEPLIMFKRLKQYFSLDAIQLQTIELKEYLSNISVADYSKDIIKITRDKQQFENQSVEHASTIQRNVAKPKALRMR